MHIPFSRDKTLVEDRHVIVLADHTREGEDDGSDQARVQDPSPNEEAEGLPPILERPFKSSAQHAIEVASGLVDVLHENQRGSFLCGIPLFSSAGLWVTDPHAWTAIDHKYTPFTIFNATLPDPTWEWVWKRWYVDMSGDVDENGWRYNINFTKHHWHGHHIWYHSFVRRRRWLRKRRKVLSTTRDARSKRFQNPADDNTTIYSAMSRSTRDRRQYSNGMMADRDGGDDDDDDEGEEYSKLENLGEFYQRLRRCRLDREKLDAVDNFLYNGRDLAALAGEMRQVMQFMLYEESRRQLLALLTRRCQILERGRGSGSGSVSIDKVDDDRYYYVKDASDMADSLINKMKYFTNQQRVTRAEEDAELDRILARRRTRVTQKSEVANEEQERENLDDVATPDLDSSVQTALKRQGRPKHGRKVSFMNESTTSATGSQAESES